MSISNALEILILDAITGGGTRLPDYNDDIFIALFTGTLSDATQTEATGTGYVRKSLTTVAGQSTAATFGVAGASSGAIDNDIPITFAPVGAAGWGTITGFGAYDAVSGGTLLWWGALTTSKVTSVGDVVAFSAGELNITLD